MSGSQTKKCPTINREIFYGIVELRFLAAGCAKRRGEARRRCHVQQNSSGTRHHTVESKRSALHVLEAGLYVHVGHISIVDLANLTVLAMLPPLLVGMHYKRTSWVSCFLKLSCVRYTANPLRAGRDSVSARLTNVEEAEVSRNS